MSEVLIHGKDSTRLEVSDKQRHFWIDQVVGDVRDPREAYRKGKLFSSSGMIIIDRSSIDLLLCHYKQLQKELEKEGIFPFATLL